MSAKFWEIFSDPHGIGYVAERGKKVVKFEDYSQADEYVELRSDDVGHLEAFQQATGLVSE